MTLLDDTGLPEILIFRQGTRERESGEGERERGEGGGGEGGGGDEAGRWRA